MLDGLEIGLIALPQEGSMPIVLPIHQANDGDEHEPMEIDENVAHPQEGAIPLFLPIHQANDGDEHEPMEIDENIAVLKKANPVCLMDW